MTVSINKINKRQDPLKDSGTSKSTDARPSSKVEYLKFASVLALIILISLGLFALGDDRILVEYMRWFMGVFLTTFAGFKFAGYKMFTVMFAGYDIIAKRLAVYGKLFPFIELSLGALYLFDVLPVGRNIIVLVVTGLAAIGVFQEVYKRRTGVHCACLGNIIKLPLSTVSVVEDVGMFVMAIIMLVI